MFSLPVNSLGHFACFPCAVGTLSVTALSYLLGVVLARVAEGVVAHGAGFGVVVGRARVQVVQVLKSHLHKSIFLSII